MTARLAGMLRRGGAGSNTTADHLQMLDDAITALPPKYRRRLIVTVDGAGAHTAARLVRGGRRRRLQIPASWPWADAIVTAWVRISALPQAP